MLVLLDLADGGVARPSLVVGAPVGLVLAPEAKEELMARSLAYIAIGGTRGGGAAAAIVNALLGLAKAKTAHTGPWEGGGMTTPVGTRTDIRSCQVGGTP